MLWASLCQGLRVLPIAGGFRCSLGFPLPSTPVSLFNTGLAPRHAEARANGLHCCFLEQEMS